MSTIPDYRHYRCEDDGCPAAERFMIQMRLFDRRKNGKRFHVSSMSFTGSNYDDCRAKIDQHWNIAKERAQGREAAKVARLQGRAKGPPVHSENDGAAQ